MADNDPDVPPQLTDEEIIRRLQTFDLRDGTVQFLLASFLPISLSMFGHSITSEQIRHVVDRAIHLINDSRMYEHMIRAYRAEIMDQAVKSGVMDGGIALAVAVKDALRQGCKHYDENGNFLATPAEIMQAMLKGPVTIDTGDGKGPHTMH